MFYAANRREFANFYLFRKLFFSFFSREIKAAVAICARISQFRFRPLQSQSKSKYILPILTKSYHGISSHMYLRKKIHKSERYFCHLLLAIFDERTILTNYFLW